MERENTLMRAKSSERSRIVSSFRCAMRILRSSTAIRRCIFISSSRLFASSFCSRRRSSRSRRRSSRRRTFSSRLRSRSRSSSSILRLHQNNRHHATGYPEFCLLLGRQHAVALNIHHNRAELTIRLTRLKP